MRWLGTGVLILLFVGVRVWLKQTRGPTDGTIIARVAAHICAETLGPLKRCYGLATNTCQESVTASLSACVRTAGQNAGVVFRTPDLRETMVKCAIKDLIRANHDRLVDSDECRSLDQAANAM